MSNEGARAGESDGNAKDDLSRQRGGNAYDDEDEDDDGLSSIVMRSQDARPASVLASGGIGMGAGAGGGSGTPPGRPAARDERNRGVRTEESEDDDEDDDEDDSERDGRDGRPPERRRSDVDDEDDDEMDDRGRSPAGPRPTDGIGVGYRAEPRSPPLVASAQKKKRKPGKPKSSKSRSASAAATGDRLVDMCQRVVARNKSIATNLNFKGLSTKVVAPAGEKQDTYGWIPRPYDADDATLRAARDNNVHVMDGFVYPRDAGVARRVTFVNSFVENKQTHRICSLDLAARDRRAKYPKIRLRAYVPTKEARGHPGDDDRERRSGDERIRLVATNDYVVLDKASDLDKLVPIKVDVDDTKRDGPVAARMAQIVGSMVDCPIRTDDADGAPAEYVVVSTGVACGTFAGKGRQKHATSYDYRDASSFETVADLDRFIVSEHVTVADAEHAFRHEIDESTVAAASDGASKKAKSSGPTKRKRDGDDGSRQKKDRKTERSSEHHHHRHRKDKRDSERDDGDGAAARKKHETPPPPVAPSAARAQALPIPPPPHPPPSPAHERRPSKDGDVPAKPSGGQKQREAERERRKDDEDRARTNDGPRSRVASLTPAAAEAVDRGALRKEMLKASFSVMGKLCVLGCTASTVDERCRVEEAQKIAASLIAGICSIPSDKNC